MSQQHYVIDVQIIEFKHEELFTDIFQASENVNLSQLKVWLLDMQASGNNLIILMGCSNPQSSNAVYFGLGTF